ncbi:PIN domain-like protein [Pilaira anomala]|nr:PIN domain-like protein [Pilaira anomala]
MGVLGLTGVLTRYAPNSVRQIGANAFAGKTIAFDASCHLNKFVFGEEPVPHRHIYGFYLLARFCQLNNITPIFVFDGPNRLKAKHLEHMKRARTRYKTDHSLLLEKDQVSRLGVWSNQTDLTTDLLSEKLDELRTALLNSEDNDRYTKTVRNLVLREDSLVSSLLQITEPSLKELKDAEPLLKELKEDTETLLKELKEDIEPLSKEDAEPLLKEDTEPLSKEDTEPLSKEDTEPLSKEDTEPLSKEDTEPLLKEDTDQIVPSLEEKSKRITETIEPLLKELKKDTDQMVRSLEKRSIRITQTMRTECQDFLTALGFVCFTCYDHEAEAMCANLSRSGRTSATVSEDLDTIVFGDAPLLRHFFSRARPILSIDPIIARSELDLSRDSFVDLCILCGTDFSGTIKGIGPHRALQWIKKYGSIENILENIASTKHVPQPTFDYQLARDVFNNLPPISENESDYIGTKQPQSFMPWLKN